MRCWLLSLDLLALLLLGSQAGNINEINTEDDSSFDLHDDAAMIPDPSQSNNLHQISLMEQNHLNRDKDTILDCHSTRIILPDQVFCFGTAAGSKRVCKWKFKTSEGYNLRFSCNPVPPGACRKQKTEFQVAGINTNKYCHDVAETFLFETNIVTFRTIFKTGKTNRMVDCKVTAVGMNATATTTTTTTTSTSSTSCTATRDYCSDCGIAPDVNVADFKSKEDRIVNGSNASPDEYPYQVLVETDVGIYTLSCGGFIIKKKWILTAAHCFFHEGMNATAARVKVGSVLKNNLRTVNVARFIIHEKYVTFVQGNDIALIELTDDLAYENDPTIQPICLALESDIPYGGKCILTGWGKLTYNDPNPSPNNLQEVALDVITTEQCKELVILPADLNQVVCTLTPSKESCRGDSGGPLVTRLCNGRWAAFGISSYGAPMCAQPNFPAVYTRVPTYADWITTNTGSADC